jgi:hypothetical protein
MEFLSREIEYFKAFEKRNPIIYISQGTLKRLTGSDNMIKFLGCNIKILKDYNYGYVLK